MAKKESGWVDVFWGVVCLALAGGSYFLFTKLEAEGGNVRIPAVILLAYKTLGKTGMAALFGGLGGLLIVYGGSKLASRSTEEEDDTPPTIADQKTP